MSAEKGDRVGAILKSGDGVVTFLGFGEYKGEEVPPESAGGLAPMVNEMNRTNPKIELDNGDVVWGCECWWGSEDQIQEYLDDADEVNKVSIHESR